jgi:hypothetical protein
MDPASRPPANTIRNIGLACLGVLALVSLVAALIVANTSTAKVRTGHVADATRSNGTVGTAASASSDAAGQALGDTGAGTDNQATANPGSHPTQQADNGPRIVYFRLRQQPRCGNSGSLPAIIEWKVSGASGAALSVDNPGIVGSYRSYSGTSGSETLTFSCGHGAGSTETHVYTIYTTGADPQRSSTITAKATVDGPSPTPKTTSQPSTAPKY